MLRAVCTLALLLVPTLLPAEDKKPRTATVLVRGVHCDACLQGIRAKLGAVKGIKLNADDIYLGEKPKYFSPPLVVKLGATYETGLGALAAAAAESATPHKDDLPPRLNLVLYTQRTIDEESVMALRRELREINGVLVLENGGLGGMPDKGLYWIRLDPAGGADLDTIFRAARKAADVSLTKE